MKISILATTQGQDEATLARFLANLQQQDSTDFDLILAVGEPLTIDLSAYDFKIDTVQLATDLAFGQVCEQLINQATGDYLCVMQLTDYLLPLAVQQWLAVIEVHPSQLIDTGRVITPLSQQVVMSDPDTLTDLLGITENDDPNLPSIDPANFPDWNTVYALSDVDVEFAPDTRLLMTQAAALAKQGYEIRQNEGKYEGLDDRMHLEGMLIHRQFLQDAAVAFDHSLGQYATTAFSWALMISAREIIGLLHPTYFRYQTESLLKPQENAAAILHQIAAYQLMLTETTADLARVAIRTTVVRRISTVILPQLALTQLSHTDRKQVFEAVVALEALIPKAQRVKVPERAKWVLTFANWHWFAFAHRANTVRAKGLLEMEAHA